MSKKTKDKTMNAGDVIWHVSQISAFIGKSVASTGGELDVIAWGLEGPEYAVWLWPKQNRIDASITQLSEIQFYAIAGYCFQNDINFGDVL